MVPAFEASCSNSSALGASLAAALHFFAASQCLVQEPWPQQASIEDGATFDFIVVGGGTAGSTIAARLAEVDNFSVLLIEAGPNPPQESVIPAFHPSLLSSSYDWNFTTVSDVQSGQALAGGRQRQPRGKMLGGSGSINNMVYSRGFPADYDDWATAAGPEWTWDNVLPYFKKTERLTDENIVHNEELMKYHGDDGEIEVSGQETTSDTIKKFLKAFKEIGFNIVDDMTNPHQIGAGRFSHTVRHGKRDSSLTALLNKVQGDNLSVIKNALVTKIIFENDRAVGVNVLIDENNMELFVKKEVIVSAGTFNTPKLLMLSGVGPKDQLESFSIDVVKDLPDVGGNLHDHVMFLNYIVADQGFCYENEATQYMEMIQYLYDRSGSLANADSMGALFALKGSDANTPDFAFYPSCMQRGTSFYKGCVTAIGLSHDVCVQLDSLNQHHDLISIAVVLLKPKSRGRVYLRSKDPLDDPKIFSGTFENADDLEGYPEAVDVVHRLAQTEYFKQMSARVVDIRVKVCDGLAGAEGVKCRARAMGTSAWHSAGTAAMGAVVDGRLRVRGLAGLRAADAAVMPRVPRGNTNAPVVMIAERAADFIKKAYGAE